MFLYGWYKLLLYHTTYIIINIKNFNWSIKNKKKNTKHIKYNNPLKSIAVRRLAEQHVIQKQQQEFYFLSSILTFFVKYYLCRKNYSWWELGLQF